MRSSKEMFLYTDTNPERIFAYGSARIQERGLLLSREPIRFRRRMYNIILVYNPIYNDYSMLYKAF